MNRVIAYTSKAFISALLIGVFLCAPAEAGSIGFTNYVPQKYNARIAKFDKVVKRYSIDVPLIREKIKQLSNKNQFEQIVEINNFVNKAKPYIEDIDNYQISDYWAVPSEFFKNGGDCEDFALTKYFILSALNFPKKDLKIFIVNDLHLKMLHSVLIVTLNGEDYILDNQSDKVNKDFRADCIIKEEILKNLQSDGYEILFVVDDRKQVVDMWRKNGILCLQCDYGDF